MMLRSRAGPRKAQPTLNATPSNRLPPAFLQCRPRDGGATPLYIDSPRGAIVSGTGYTGITLDQSRVGWGVKSAAGASDGIVITLSTSGTQWDRTTWAWAGLVRVDSVPGSAGAIVALNGTLNGLELRINSSSQIELLSEAAALLATSSYAGFTAGSIRHVGVLCSAALSTTYVIVDGSIVITYAGTIDNKDPSSAMEMALLRRGNTTSEKLAGTLFGCSFWTGVSATPSLALFRELLTPPGGGVYAAYRARRRVRPPVASGSTLLAQGAADAASQAIGAAQQLTQGAGAGQAPGQAVGAGQVLMRADGVAAGAGQAAGVAQALARADGAAQAAGQAIGAGQAQVRLDGVAAAAGQATAVGNALVPGVDTGVSVAPGQAAGQGQILMRADGVAAGAGQAAAAAQALARGDGAAQGAGQAAGQGQALARADGAAAAAAQATGTEAAGPPPPPPPPPADESVTTPGYRRNPRSPRDLDPLPPRGEDLPTWCARSGTRSRLPSARSSARSAGRRPLLRRLPPARFLPLHQRRAAAPPRRPSARRSRPGCSTPTRCARTRRR